MHWRIRDGLLVARRDDGYLEIDVRRCPTDRQGYERAHVEVEVANFYPALARPFKWFYVNTQSRIHVIVTHGFLKRLARLELEESAVGRFAPPPEAAVAGAAATRQRQRRPAPSRARGRQRRLDAVAAVAALAASFALLALVSLGGPGRPAAGPPAAGAER